MKRKIYNKKNFLSGAVFLILGAADIITTIISMQNHSNLGIIKSVVIGVLCLLIGLTQVYRSLNEKCTREDDQNDDEREKFILIKSKSKTSDIIFYVSLAITIISVLIFAVTRKEVWIGIITYNLILITFLLITEIICNVYYSKKN